MSRVARLTIGVLLAGAALLAAGCGSSDDGEGSTAASATATSAEPAPSSGKRAAGADADRVPAALAANREQANQILDEGSLNAKLEELRGHPIVVNQWGSWCPPCRAEFPYFAESAEQHASDVAFLGVDMQDERGAAERFLQEFPVPYPSVDDPTGAAIASLGGGVVSPTTVFIDENGEIVNVFQGAYNDVSELEADIDKHLLG